MGDLRGPLDTERVEEPSQRGLVAAGRGPHQRAAVVIDDHGQVAVATLVGDLVDPDPTQPGETVHPGVDVGRDAGHDRPHRPPGDAHQLDHRRLGALRGQPRHRLVEVAGVPDSVTGPRHLDHRGTMRRAVRPAAPPPRAARERRPDPDPATAADPHLGRTTQPAAHTVRSAAAHPCEAVPRPPPPRRPRRTPPPRSPCAPARARAAIRSRSAPRSASRFQVVRQLGNVRSRRGATADGLLSHPRIRQGSPFSVAWEAGATNFSAVPPGRGTEGDGDEEVLEALARARRWRERADCGSDDGNGRGAACPATCRGRL